MNNKFWPVKEEDLLIIASQIGRPPRAVRSIARRCPHDYPVVAVSAPIFYDAEKQISEFFPTTYWLTCPQLRKRIARLENEGLITRLEKVFSLNLELKEMLAEAHASYIHQRFALIGREEFFDLKKTEVPWRERILKVGIGGIEDFKHLKCLHAHIAHYLAVNDNPVGMMALEFITSLFCESEKAFCQRQNASKPRPASPKDY